MALGEYCRAQVFHPSYSNSNLYVFSHIMAMLSKGHACHSRYSYEPDVNFSYFLTIQCPSHSLDAGVSSSEVPVSSTVLLMYIDLYEPHIAQQVLRA